jgi:hypothetical protein
MEMRVRVVIENAARLLVLKDAREAYLAWCEGKPIEYRREGENVTRWREDPTNAGFCPAFASIDLHWRPTPDYPAETPPRTPQQASREARESGAVEAWENGKPIEFQSSGVWHEYSGSLRDYPAFMCCDYHWRPKASEPPNPVALDWRPSSEPPKDGEVVLVWDGEGWLWDQWDKSSAGLYTAWAPQPLPPEV